RHYEEEEEEDKKNTNKPARTSKVMKNEQGELEFDLYFAFSKFDEEQGIVAGIVYEPDVKDAQG
ncbi:MAG: hypothetical protein GWN86_00460, partial [Desulfobacterales bacterium]|nr:hypothetical protein [Desulfobacterales bacterium]